MMVLIAILAILLGVGQWAYDRYGRQTVAKTYYIVGSRTILRSVSEAI